MRLEEICARYGLALIVDEVFLDYPLAEDARLRELCGGAASGVDVCAEWDEQDRGAAADEGGVDCGLRAGG